MCSKGYKTKFLNSKGNTNIFLITSNKKLLFAKNAMLIYKNLYETAEKKQFPVLHLVGGTFLKQSINSCDR